jgi:hypothetical protein
MEDKMSVPAQMTNLLRERREGAINSTERKTKTYSFSYVASLESRVDKLEKRLQYAKIRQGSITTRDPDTLTPSSPVPQSERKDSLAAIRAAIHGKAVRRREATDVNELVSDFGFMLVATFQR